MNTEHRERLKTVAAHLEESLQTFDAILESEDIAALYPASRSVLAALMELHGADATLLSAEGRTRVEEQINKEKRKRSGRDSFNTGF